MAIIVYPLLWFVFWIDYGKNSHRALLTFVENPAIVCWQEDRKLIWDDFQATVEPQVPELDTTYMAVAAITEANAVQYESRTDEGKIIRSFVRVEFYKDKSWANKKRVVDDPSTLEHEQLHFDIAELTGRRIRRVLARCAAQHIDYNSPTIRQEIAAIYDAEDALSERYDEEAGYGDNKAQKRWQLFIGKALFALRQFKSTAADCEVLK